MATPSVATEPEVLKSGWRHKLAKVLAQLGHSVHVVVLKIFQPVRSLATSAFASKTGTLLFLVGAGITLAIALAWSLRVFRPKSQITVASFEIFTANEKSAGLTGRALADLLVDDLHDILDEAIGFSGSTFSSKKSQGKIPDMPQIPVETTYGIEIKGVSLDQVIATWDHIRYQQYRISGDLIIGPEKGTLLQIRVESPGRAGSFHQALDSLEPNSVQQAMNRLALELMGDMHPEVAARFLVAQAFKCTDDCPAAWTRAVQFCSDWTKREPKSASAFFWLGYGLGYSGYDRYAIDALERATHLDSSLAKAFNAEGFYYDALGDRDTAEKKYREALGFRAMLPQPVLWVLVKLGVAIPANPLLNLGMGQLDEGHYDKAETYFLRALAVDSEDLGAYLDLGADLIKMSRYEEAIGVFQKALLISPDNASALNGLVLALLKDNRAGGAEYEVKRAEHLHPGSQELLLVHSKLLIAETKAKDAIDLLEEQSSATNNNEITVQLFRAYLQEGELDSARAKLQPLLDRYPKLAILHFLRSKLYQAEGMPSKAQEDIAEADRLDPAFRYDAVDGWDY